MFREYLTEWDKQFASLFDDEIQLALEDSSGEIASKQPETVKSSDDKKDDEDEEGSKSDAKDTIKEMKIGSRISELIEKAKKKILELINKIEEFFAKKKAAKEKADWEAGYHSFVDKMRTWENTKKYEGKKKCDAYTPVDVNKLGNTVNFFYNSCLETSKTIKEELEKIQNIIDDSYKELHENKGNLVGINHCNSRLNEFNETCKLNKLIDDAKKMMDDDDSDNEDYKKEIILESQKNVVLSTSILETMKNVIKNVPEWNESISKGVGFLKKVGEEFSAFTKRIVENKFSIVFDKNQDALTKYTSGVGTIISHMSHMASTLSDCVDEAYVSAKTVIEFCYEDDDD